MGSRLDPSSLWSADVIRARRTERIAIAAPGDFILGARRPVARDSLAGALPYCLDVLHRRAVYVGGVEARSAQDAPFYYLHLRRQAQSVASAPWEMLPLTRGIERAPVFVFSPGRCGSTLLSRLLGTARYPNVSEPDFYTQVTTAFAASAFNPLRETMAGVAAAMGSDLAAALDPALAPVVKLRAESCRAPELLVRPAERRTIYMTRDFEAWARSNGRAFRNEARKSVGKYLRAMTCHAWLRAHSDCHVLNYETLLAQPDETAATLGRFLRHAIPPEAVAATMKEDSQEGTPLEQGARGDLPGWERRFEETMALWNSAKVRRVRDRLGAL